MAIRIVERGEVVKGVLVVQPDDHLFWFNRPRLLLYLINFVLFQNAFQLGFFVWTWKEFGLRSCFHERLEDIIIRISMGVLIQILCSYVTLPLYALVTQMGSSMKPTIFNERVITALRNWHQTAKRNIKQNRGSVTPMSDRSISPSHHMSPVHLLRHYRSQIDSLRKSPMRSNFDVEHCKTDSPSTSCHNYGEGSSSHHHNQQEVELGNVQFNRDEINAHGFSKVTPISLPAGNQHEIDLIPSEFSFDRRSSI